MSHIGTKDLLSIAGRIVRQLSTSAPSAESLEYSEGSAPGILKIVMDPPTKLGGHMIVLPRKNKHEVIHVWPYETNSDGWTSLDTKIGVYSRPSAAVREALEVALHGHTKLQGLRVDY